MYILEHYYNTIIKYDLINKFCYSNKKKIPKLTKVILNLGCNGHEVKKIAASLLSLELISKQRGTLTLVKNSNVLLKIRKGAPVGCKVVLKKSKMYQFLFKLLVEVFPRIKDFKGLILRKNNNANSFSFYINDLMVFKELNTNFYLFNNLPSLNIILVSNTKTKKEFTYLLNSFKIPILVK